MIRRGRTYRSNDIITSAVGVVVPLESNFVAAVDVDRLGGLDASGVALDVLGHDVQNGVVVGRRVDVAALLVAYALVLAIDEDVPIRNVSLRYCVVLTWSTYQTVVWAAAN
jgi:hypothetical protein